MHQASPSARKSATALLAALLVPGLAIAHPQDQAVAGIWAGFVHPLTGIDHALAMLAVGLWASRMGRGAVWVLSAIFPLAMIAGAGLGAAGVQLPAIETMLAASVVVLGLAVATGIRLPLIASAPLVSLFAVFHGFAHFSEAPVTADELNFVLGFVVATVLLHIAGVAGGAHLALTSMKTDIFRVGGTFIAATGAVLMVV